MTTPRVRLYAYEEAQNAGVEAAAVLSPTRGTLAAIRARFAVMRRLRDDGFHVTQIARWLGRDHSTVVHGLQHKEQANGRS